MSTTHRLAVLSTTLLLVLGCGGGLPEVTPGLFDTPKSVEDHGRIVAKSYRRSNGPHDTIRYTILEIDGKPMRFEDGYVWKTSFPEDDGLEAVVFTGRGRNGAGGIWVLQLDGDDRILERICEYSPYDPKPWTGHRFEGCEVGWDARRKRRI